MSSTNRNPIATYSLIYSFLTERSHFKAAEAVKKAVKGVIDVQGGDQDGPTLPVILNQWKKLTAGQGRKATAPYVWYRYKILDFKLTTHSNRSKSAHSESSSSDSDSDCMVLVQDITF